MKDRCVPSFLSYSIINSYCHTHEYAHLPMHKHPPSHLHHGKKQFLIHGFFPSFERWIPIWILYTTINTIHIHHTTSHSLLIYLSHYLLDGIERLGKLRQWWNIFGTKIKFSSSIHVFERCFSGDLSHFGCFCYWYIRKTVIEKTKKGCNVCARCRNGTRSDWV